jgi:hypothetical protein
MRLFQYGHDARYSCHDRSAKDLENARAYLKDVKNAIRHEWPGTVPKALG